MVIWEKWRRSFIRFCVFDVWSELDSFPPMKQISLCLHSYITNSCFIFYLETLVWHDYIVWLGRCQVTRRQSCSGWFETFCVLTQQFFRSFIRVKRVQLWRWNNFSHPSKYFQTDIWFYSNNKSLSSSNSIPISAHLKALSHRTGASSDKPWFLCMAANTAENSHYSLIGSNSTEMVNDNPNGTWYKI